MKLGSILALTALVLVAAGAPMAQTVSTPAPRATVTMACSLSAYTCAKSTGVPVAGGGGRAQGAGGAGQAGQGGRGGGRAGGPPGSWDEIFTHWHDERER